MEKHIKGVFRKVIMTKRFAFILLVINTIFILALDILYDAILNINGIVFVIIILWTFIMLNVVKTDLKKSKKILCIFAFAIITLNNVILIYNVPKFTYNEACEIISNEVIDKYPEKTLIEKADNNNIKYIVNSKVHHTFFDHNIYIIILNIQETKNYFWFNPFTGEHSQFNLEEALLIE
ncbi:MAG: hypothetical protein PHY44_03820 [Lachnospiraceae bacterium]|nr:hypothetical protein [Lachnospiraceae bacterium]